MLKFAQDNPLIMTTGMGPKEWDLVLEFERKQAMLELEKTIKELEKIIIALSERYQVLTVEISKLEKEIDIIEEQCSEAALNLYTPPRDPDESTEINLAEIMALQPHLPADESKHILKINHTSIINNFNEKLRRNPKGINRDRIEADLYQAIREKVQEKLDEHIHLYLFHIPADKRNQAVSEIQEHIQKIEIAVQVYENADNASLIDQASQERDQKAIRLSEARGELEGVGELLRECEKMKEVIKSQDNLVSMQKMSRIITELEKLRPAENDEKISMTPQQTKNTSAFIKKQSAVSNPDVILEGTITEKSSAISSLSNNEIKPHETKEAVISSTVVNEYPIQHDEDKKSNNEISNKSEDKIQERQHTTLEERGLFAARNDQQQIKVTGDSKSIAGNGQEAEATQNKRPARVKRTIPGQKATIEKSEEQNSSPANDSTFKLRP